MPEFPINSELIARVETKMLDTVLLAQKRFNVVFELPSLSFDLNSDNIAGTASRHLNKITINPKYLHHFPDDTINDTINDTIPHEIAHLVTFKCYPHAKQYHGPEWKRVAKALGCNGERCHTLNLPGKTPRKLKARPYKYQCNCITIHNLSPLQHNKILAGSTYKCRQCKTRLKFIKITVDLL